MALHVCVAPLSNEPAQVVAVWSWVPPYLAAERVERVLPAIAHTCLHHYNLPQGTRGARTSVGAQRQAVTPWPSLHCTFCASSIGDLCMARPAGASARSASTEHGGLLFWKHFTVQLRSLHRFCRPTGFSIAAQRAPRSHARLLGGTLSAVCTGAGRTISAARLSAAHGLASYNLLASVSIATLACSSTATPDESRSVFAARAAAILRMHLACRSVQCFAYVRHHRIVQVDS